MSALTVDRRELPIMERAAIHLGTTLILWGQRRALARRASVAADAYRGDYTERVSNASAVVRQGLLP